MPLPDITPADLAGLKGRRFRVHKEMGFEPNKQTCIVTAITFWHGKAYLEIEWEIPSDTRIPVMNLVTREEFHEHFTEC